MLIPLETFLHRVFPPGSYPEDGERLAVERLFQPRRGATAIRVEVPIDWEAPSNSADRNWRMQLQGWTMFHPVMNVFDDLADKTRSIDYFFEVALDWWGKYGDDPENIVTGRTPESYAWYDMSVGFRALIISFFANRIDHFDLNIGPDLRELLELLASKHATHLRNPAVFYPSNHGIFQMHGLRALGETFTYPQSEADAEYAEQAMQRLLNLQFDSNGVHLEHSPHYHIYALRMFESVELSGWYRDMPDFTTRLDSAKSIVPWLVDPLRRPAAIGDSIPTEQRDLAFPDLNAKDPLVLSDFDTSGYAIARSGWGVSASDASYLFFMGAYHSKTHKHRDCLSFEWFDRGSKRITDSGKYGYFGDDKRRYVLSSRAHNSVEIEGLDILRMQPYGSAIKDGRVLDGGVYFVTGELEFKAIAHRRDLYMLPGAWLVVDDDLAFNRSRNATQWFHPALGHQLTSLRDGQATFTGPDGIDLAIQSLTPDVQMQIHFGDEQSNQGYVSESDDHIEPGFALGFSTGAQFARMTTVVALGATERREAVRFAVRELELDPQESTTLVEDPGRETVIDAIGLSSLELQEGTHSYRLTVKGCTTKFVARHKGSDSLVVVLDSTARRAPDLVTMISTNFLNLDSGTVVMVADPAFARCTAIDTGWFLGTENSDDLEAIRNLVVHLQGRLNISDEKTSIGGSGPAGFAALKLGERLPHVMVVADRPMLPLDDPGIDRTLAITHPGWSPEQARLAFERRLRLSETMIDQSAEVIILRDSSAQAGKAWTDGLLASPKDRVTRRVRLVDLTDPRSAREIFEGCLTRIDQIAVQ